MVPPPEGSYSPFDIYLPVSLENGNHIIYYVLKIYENSSNHPVMSITLLQPMMTNLAPLHGAITSIMTEILNLYQYLRGISTG